jgi:Fic family protein
MQKPPDRRNPPVLFARGTSQWIARVNQKHKQLVTLDLSTKDRERLDQWTEIEFVYSTLKLEGLDVTRGQVVRAASTIPGQAPDEQPAASALLVSLRTVTSLARENRRTAELTGELLLKLHNVPGSRFRKSEGNTSRVTKPVAPEHLPALIETAFLWYTAESFAELNPIEQASIVLLRLIDLQPFDQANERTALVAASLFTVRSELPPIIITPQLAPIYRNALDEGTRMNTKPMVETLAEAVEQSLTEILRQIGKKK